MTRLLGCCHLDSAEARNWSIITWGTIGKVSELSLPTDEHVGYHQGVAIIEAEDSGFGEERVVATEISLVLGEVLEGNVTISVLGVVEDGMALRESAATNILPGEADGAFFHEEACESERLCVCPVEVLAAFDRAFSGSEKAFLERWIDLKVFRDGQEAAPEREKQVLVDAGRIRAVGEFCLLDCGGSRELAAA